MIDFNDLLVSNSIHKLVITVYSEILLKFEFVFIVCKLAIQSSFPFYDCIVVIEIWIFLMDYILINWKHQQEMWPRNETNRNILQLWNYHVVVLSINSQSYGLIEIIIMHATGVISPGYLLKFNVYKRTTSVWDLNTRRRITLNDIYNVIQNYLEYPTLK